MSFILKKLRILSNNCRLGKKVNPGKAFFKKKFLQRKYHSISSSALPALIRYANSGLLVQTEERGTVYVFKKCFVADMVSYLCFNVNRATGQFLKNKQFTYNCLRVLGWRGSK